MIRTPIIVLISINLFYLAFAQDTIEGRWHLVGYEDNVMYQFENNYRYSIYSLDGNFGGLEDAGGSPNPYSIVEDIITLDLFFGTIVNYQMNFICDGQVVEFKNINYGTVHSKHFREGYDYGNSSCNDIIDECEPGFIEINDLCFHEGDINIIQKLIDNSYQSGIDLGCQEGDIYCGSPNPFMDTDESWMWVIVDGESYGWNANVNGLIEPLELGVQEWQNGRLTSLMCGAYIYCQLSGPIPEEINDLTELETLRLEGNYLSGFVPEPICDLDINFDDYLEFDISYNHLCPPYPDCINTEGFWDQNTEDCEEIDQIGDLNSDDQINVMDIIIIVSSILNGEYNILGDLNEDGQLNIIDVVNLVEMILNP